MMEDNKKNRPQAREPYEPVKVEVTTVTSQGVLCASAGATINGMNQKSANGFV